MKRIEQSGWSIDDIAEAFDGIIAPEEVKSVMGRFIERKQAEEQELARMQRMIDIIDEFDEVLLLEREDGKIVKPDSMLYTAADYLYNLRGQPIIDDLDEKARLLSLYMLATFDGPYNGGEMIDRHIDDHPVSATRVKALMKQYVVEKFGHDAWSEDYDNLDFFDLFDEMRYFDGEAPTEILEKQPLVKEISDELVEQGFGLKIRGRDK